MSSNNSNSQEEMDPSGNVHLNHNKKQELQPSTRKRYDLNKYIKYSKSKNISKCLIRNCDRCLKGRYIGNIKRHYNKLHNFIIIHTSASLEEIKEQESDCETTELDKYFDYDPLMNKSICKALDCNAAFADYEPENLLLHYSQVHNTEIKPEENLNRNDDKNRKAIILRLEDLYDYDDKNKTYQCLFKNCTVFEVHDLEDVKKHYLEKHDIIMKTKIDKPTDNICKIRYLDVNDVQSLKSDQEFLSETETEESETEDEPIPKKRKYTKHKAKINSFNYEKYVELLPEQNSTKCLLENCCKIMSGMVSNNIKRHYLSIHNMYVLHGKYASSVEECEKLLGKNYNESSYYPMHEFVTIQRETNSFKCLFKTCSHLLPKELMAVKTHYQEAHQIIITKRTRQKILKKTIKKDHSEKESYIDDNEQFNYSSLPIQKKPKIKKSMGLFNYANYVEYKKDLDISKCLIKSCERNMKGCIVGNVKRHFLEVHKFLILQRRILPTYEEIKDELQDFKIEKYVPSFRCLFTNCNEILERNVDNIQRHYYEKHKVVIENDKGNKRNRILQITKHVKKDYDDDDDGSNVDDGLDDTFSIHNECLSDEDETKRSHNFSENIHETQSCFIKNEITIDDNVKELHSDNVDDEHLAISNYSYSINQNIQEKTDISKENSLTKNKFLKLCLGLIIKHDLPLKLFDDETYFKPLLAPYEDSVNSDINSKKMEELMLIANHTIMGELKESFNNKIVCLELYALRHEMKNYLIFNIRYLDDETIQNKIIGFLPITETTTILPITEYLNKFDITEKQVYMKTIIATTQDHEEIYKICENLCNYNPDIKYHPIHDLQLILRSFKEKYSQEIKNWKELTNYKDRFNQDILHNLKDFAKHVKSLLDTNNDLKPQLQKAKKFFKTLQIFWNFFNKLSAEQYVAGDFYRDWLCCELELKGEVTKTNNTYAETLSEQFLNYKNSLLEMNEFLGALYLDVRFNFLGTRLMNDEQKSKAKLFLGSVWEKFGNIVDCYNNVEDPLLNSDIGKCDEYALLDQHFNDNTNVSIQDKLTIWVPVKREPFSLNILKFWRSNRQIMTDINELTKIAFSFPASLYVLKNLQNNFCIFNSDTNKYDKFVIKFNKNILEKQNDLIFDV